MSETSLPHTHSGGLLVAGANGQIVHADPLALAMLGLESGAISNLAQAVPRLADLVADGDGLFRGSGLAVRAVALPGGGTLLDIQPEENDSAFYRSIFENSVYGTYRDHLDGRPVRCNPALARLNGYECDREYLEAVSARPTDWYLDPARSAEFRRRLDKEGRVRDMVSEVYRHRTGETVWITENAWYVRDASGKPCYIEGTIQDATERVAATAALERQANTDALTGAASRYCFLNRLRAETRPESAGTVLYIVDLDHFKQVNDMLGHNAGDVVLKTVASRLQSIAGSTGFVARLGGDEFAILQVGRHFHVNADNIASAIVKALRQPVVVDGRGMSIGCSVGAAVYPAHAGSAEELLSNADLALYEAKSGGRNGFRMFDHELKRERDRRKALEDDLKQAIGENELELYYQPLTDAQSERIMGFEALMRWNHPVKGFLPPGQFISIAEEAGLMAELGNWAIWRACEQAVTFPGHIAVSVNVSPTQFRSASIVSVVRQALATTGLSPTRLILEVTESAILPVESLAAVIIGDLQSLGVQLALDDFGTGYSSLSYLQRFQFSKLKIDRSFVAGIGQGSANLAIIRAVLSLCRELEIDVVAEGIETGEQASLIRGLGCQLLQGYLYGKPLPFAEAVSKFAASELRSAAPRQEYLDLDAIA